jgi:hypothetical protein
MRKLLLTGTLALALSLLAVLSASAQDSKEIKMLENENWWGSVTDLGRIMPFDDETDNNENIHSTKPVRG